MNTTNTDPIPSRQSPASPFEAAQKAILKGDVAALEQTLSENTQLFKYEQPPAYTGRRPMHIPILSSYSSCVMRLSTQKTKLGETPL
jgi:hypothetical protein